MSALSSQIESILFAAGEAVEKRELIKRLRVDRDTFSRALEELRERYKKDSGIVLSETKSTLKLTTNPDNFEVVKRVLNLEENKKLSKAGAEVLALIAYRAPITRIEIDAVRGVNSSGALQRLIDQGLIKECGRKDVPGKPFLYETTDDFLRFAGIMKREDLPSFDNFNKKKS